MWAALVLPDGTMVSGDAAGGVQFWDARLGTRLASFHRHAADVLALAAAPEGNAVFAAGVDSQLAAFKLVTGQKGAATDLLHCRLFSTPVLHFPMDVLRAQLRLSIGSHSRIGCILYSFRRRLAPSHSLLFTLVRIKSEEVDMHDC